MAALLSGNSPNLDYHANNVLIATYNPGQKHFYEAKSPVHEQSKSIMNHNILIINLMKYYILITNVIIQ